MNESEVPPPLPPPPGVPREPSPETRFCDLCNTPLDPTHEGRVCTGCEARAPTDRCPAPQLVDEDGADEHTHPGPEPGDPFEDPRFKRFLLLYEQGLDKRFESIVGWLAEIRDELRQDIDEIRSAVRAQASAAEQQTELIRRWADDAAVVVTRVEQLAERVERREHYCAAQHGNGASLPPDP